MKTIFIPIFYRPQARNVLRTDILKTLISNKDVRVIIFVPIEKLEEYKNEFQNENIIFEGIDEPLEFISRMDKLFGRLALFYIDSPTGRFNRKEWLLYGKKSPARYLISMFFLLLFGNIKIFRTITRFFDFYFIKDNRYQQYFEKYQPNLIFLSNFTTKIDRAFLRHAKKNKIFSVGMINAWDNITLAKYPFRILPDKLIAYNKIIKEEAEKYIDMQEKDIFISGWPHFDHYVNSKRISREEFCKKLGINSQKRILLFASIGSTLNPTEWQTLSLLDKAILDGRLPDDLTIIFRQHPTEKTKMENVKTSGHVVIDDSKTIIKKEDKNYSEILKSDMDHLADSLFHSDVTINTCSTMSIDAAVFDKPIVNIAFDGLEQKPFHQSVRKFYTIHHVHYQPIMKTKGVKIAYNIDELVKYINMYLENPSLDKDNRKRIVEEQCYKLDGRSGQRIGEYLLLCAG
ncbi:CDP-glycerol glycerophosphotransferase family protein [Patescibacteria group bacterium]|nr:CDP-glycerol glycerophosphotransferase family protein [Patescibacteria group bacterium]